MVREFERAELGSIAEILAGKMLNRATDVPGDGRTVRPFLATGDVTWGRVGPPSKSMLFDDASWGRYSVSDGDLLVLEGGDPGRCAVYRGDRVGFQNHIHRVRAKESEASNEFLALAVEFAYRTGSVAALRVGTTIKSLSSSRLKKLQVPLPGLREQQRIVDVMAAADTYVEALRGAQAAAVSARDALVDTPSGESLEAMALGDMLLPSPRATPTRNLPEQFRYAALSDVKRDTPLSVAELPLHDANSAPSRARMLVRAGDVIVATVGAHNKGFALIGDEMSGHIVSTGFCVLRSGAGTTPAAVYAIVRRSSFTDWVARHTRGTALPSARGADIRKFPVGRAYSDADLAAITAADNYVIAASLRREAAERARGQLLADLLSGTHRIPDSYDAFMASRGAR